MREFLKGLELDKETIDTIMAEYGKNITQYKEEVEDYKGQIDGYKNQVEGFKTEIDGYKTTIDGLNGTIEQNKSEIENLQNVTSENRNLKAQLQMSDSNVKKEFSKFVTSEIMAQVNEENDFATVLDNYKKENPQYFGDTVVKKVQTSPELTGGTKPQSTSDIMNDLIRSANM